MIWKANLPAAVLVSLFQFDQLFIVHNIWFKPNCADALEVPETNKSILVHFLVTTSLLWGQRTCQRLAEPRHLGRDGVRRASESGRQCWCPCPGKRGDSRPGSFPPHSSFLLKLLLAKGCHPLPNPQFF